MHTLQRLTLVTGGLGSVPCTCARGKFSSRCCQTATSRAALGHLPPQQATPKSQCPHCQPAAMYISRICAAAPARKAPRKHSGLQQNVLKLYRAALRAAAAKRDPESRRSARAFISFEFHKNAAAIKRSDVQRIEHLLRIGERQLGNWGGPDTPFHWVTPSTARDERA